MLFAAGIFAEPLYRDASQPIPARVADLLPRLSVEEKIAQLANPHYGEEDVKKYYGKTGVGAVKYMSAFHCGTNLTKCMEQRNQLQADFINSTEHGIPVAFVNEGLHGGAPRGSGPRGAAGLMERARSAPRPTRRRI